VGGQTETVEPGRALNTRFAKIAKVDEEKRLVYGVVLVPDEEDLQGDVISAEESRKAAHGYLLKRRVLGEMHVRAPEGVDLVESYIAPLDFELGGMPVSTGSWVICVHVPNDAVWGKVKDRTYTGFSIGWDGRRELV
jgi:DNA adenine methylase